MDKTFDEKVHWLYERLGYTKEWYYSDPKRTLAIFNDHYSKYIKEKNDKILSKLEDDQRNEQLGKISKMILVYNDYYNSDYNNDFKDDRFKTTRRALAISHLWIN